MTKLITIDGPSGAGKGTLSQLIAAELGWPLLDSGAIYRVLGQAAYSRDIEKTDVDSLVEVARHLDVRFANGQVILDGEDVSALIRTEEGGKRASDVASIPEVRAALLQRQRDFATDAGLIADGRDMGTVVFPQAPLKIYLTASAQARAERRYKQLTAAGVECDLAGILEQVNARDEQDMNRATAPLKPANDAVTIDSSNMTVEQVMSEMMSLAKQRDLI